MSSIPWIAYPVGMERHNFLDLVKQGYWTRHSASIDCCELNYSKSDWIAEYYNTMTSLVILILGIQALTSSIQQQLPKRFRISTLGILALGITSSLHHATLRFEFQLLEELVFVWLTSLGAWIVWDLTPVHHVSSWNMMTALIVISAAFTISHILHREPILMELYHGWTSVLLIARLAQLMTSKILADSKEAQDGRRMIRSAAALGGFALIACKADRSFCIPSTTLKIFVFPRIAFLLEGHAWSHLLWGLSLQRLISGIVLITMSIRDDPDHLVGMTCGWIEVVERTEKGWKALGESRSSQRGKSLVAKAM